MGRGERGKEGVERMVEKKKEERERELSGDIILWERGVVYSSTVTQKAANLSVAL